MIGGRAVVRLRSFGLIGFAGFAFAGDAAAGQYACEVPIAVLCQGCATGVSITLEALGGCRVAFNPTSVAAAGLTGSVSFRISAPSAPAFPRRVSYRSRVTASPRAGGACFLFNGQQYCELSRVVEASSRLVRRRHEGRASLLSANAGFY
jgi:hypothetical protein